MLTAKIEIAMFAQRTRKNVMNEMRASSFPKPTVVQSAKIIVFCAKTSQKNALNAS